MSKSVLIQVMPNLYELDTREYVVAAYILNRCEFYEGVCSMTIQYLMRVLDMLDEEIDEFIGRLYTLKDKGFIDFEQAEKNPCAFTFYVG